MALSPPSFQGLTQSHSAVGAGGTGAHTGPAANPTDDPGLTLFFDLSKEAIFTFLTGGHGVTPYPSPPDKVAKLKSSSGSQHPQNKAHT